MTRRDYELIARSIAKAKPARVHMLALDAACVAWLACVTSLAHDLSQDNPRFDPVRFMEACGKDNV